MSNTYHLNHTVEENKIKVTGIKKMDYFFESSFSGYDFYTTKEIPTEKYELVKNAIERELNGGRYFNLSNTLKEGLFWGCVVFCFALIFIPFEKIWEQPKEEDAIKSIWVDFYNTKEKSGGGRYYNSLKKINDSQYLFLGKDLHNITFDSTIITINK